MDVGVPVPHRANHGRWTLPDMTRGSGLDENDVGFWVRSDSPSGPRTLGPRRRPAGASSTPDLRTLGPSDLAPSHRRTVAPSHLRTFAPRSYRSLSIVPESIECPVRLIAW